MANNTEKMLKADMHIHSNASFDATYAIDKIISIANKNNVHTISITDHNTYSGIRSYCLENGLSLFDAVHKINGLYLIPGIEITCVMPQIPNIYNCKSKFHLLVYGARMDRYSPLAQLIKLKHQNDELVDYGLLKIISNKYKFKITSNSIKNYVIQKRGEQTGFGRFGAQSVVDFLNFNNIQIGKSERELLKMLKKAPVAERLELDLEDVIKLAHASGGICVLAHPKKNLDRTEHKEQAIKQMLNMGIDGFEIINNSMDQATFELIMKACKQYKGKNKLLFTGGSDMHYESANLTVGSTYKNIITKTSQQQFIDEIFALEKARMIGLLTHRDYKVPHEKAIENMVKEYSKKAEMFEQNYMTAKFEFDGSKNEKLKKSGKKIIINPQDYASFDEYIEATLSNSSSENPLEIVKSK